MTDIQIIIEALKKARDNGCKKFAHMAEPHNIERYAVILSVFPNDVIFDQEFAEAFWGDECGAEYGCPEWGHLLKWEYHLQKMVIQDNSIKYLEQFLTQNNHENR